MSGYPGSGFALQVSAHRLLITNLIDTYNVYEAARRAGLGGVWLSWRDCPLLIERCLDADEVRWTVVYGISNNPRQFWDLSHAREVLGYAPEDR